MIRRKIIAASVIIVLVGIVAGYVFISLQHKPFHEHANFALYLNGERYNFSQERYMTTEDNEVGLRAFVHMHDMNGGAIHLHTPGMTLGIFFESIGIQLNSTCLVMDNGTSYCSGGKMYVNGGQSNEFDRQVPDLDRILLTFGN